ncbi:cytochrome c biogenesis protein ResB [Acidipropionibacterium jensenii]|uniref:Cytochrome c biogenesis protein CcsB n=1 Tax=Acidipropionibacterium jensenii TaxID=1749 RepID=A0A448P112_9ACTN|nr:cytochrome c biogenesis protein ResB [Acidipropionibacterium jensenii]MDN6556160.1 cytochrome c biogenesis protein ResB [Acidipropionibacterium acidipropionici]MDN5976406.1 cytochrome c biogenesis protein ResB [Acidipropionibacterium jensenii]MDN5996148.1 cytochrome c biogenesis protein ResB [Acidipropionibacterium jensenii]MDN6426247.1 cytochrome c biogenesis protein ResB [Acidipropionibacterium jensenii]MDN6441713.1 cytochrome c biogenesis protein ResB [Acidipropionibacterium jensenii]
MTDSTKALGLRATARWIWGQLTSMRTALVLLFLLAAAAIPGSLIPQTASSAIKVADFAAAHPTLDAVYRRLGLYHVYTSTVFSAIYLLLFISLIGCIIPRITAHLRALRRQPPRTPARLDRLPEHAERTIDATPADAERITAAARSWLRSRHYRVALDEDGSVRAERGIHRETGNLVFHVFLVVLLVAIGWNTLWGYKGSAVVVEGQGFSNNLTQFDDFHAGAMVNTDTLTPFSLVLKKFNVTFETGPVQRGAARQFAADVSLTRDGRTSEHTLEVNHPLTLGSTNVHLLGHGYAPVVKVTDGNGHVAFQGAVAFVPQDGNFSSTGVIKVPDARPDRLAFQGFFLPTASVGATGPVSIFPDTYNPQLFLNAWYGKPIPETGTPQNLYVLNTTGMTQVSEKGQKVSFALRPGQGYRLPGGQGRIEFTGYQRWTKIQVSHSPGLPLLFASVLISVAGLCVSLFTRPRRLWLRVRPDGDRLTIQVGGLDRADARAGLDEDVTDLLGVAGGATVSPIAAEEAS